MSEGETAPPRPLLRVVSGAPSPEELAALVLVVTARAAAANAEAPQPSRVGWTSRHDQVRHTLLVGPGAWLASGRSAGVRTRASW